MTHSMEGNEWGAVDLSPMAAEGATQEGPPSLSGVPPMPAVDDSSELIDAPLIVDVTEATFDQQMALSMAVPIVLVLYSPNSLASKQALGVMEGVARSSGGAFQLGRVNVDVNPALAAAFQAQAIPAGYAVLAQRPVPLFEGVPTPQQVGQVLGELLQVAPQMGVVGRINVGEADTEKPMPPEHEPAREAEMLGDWDAAIKAWKKVLASNPGDSEAKQALARAKFERRFENQEQDAAEAVDAQADALFAAGREEEAFTLLLDALISADTPEEQETLREQLVGLFQIAADSAAVKAARRRLATYLMV